MDKIQGTKRSSPEAIWNAAKQTDRKINILYLHVSLLQGVTASLESESDRSLHNPGFKLCLSRGLKSLHITNICTSHYPRVQISKSCSFSAIVSDPCFSLLRLCNRINSCHSSIPEKETRSENIQKVSYYQSKNFFQGLHCSKFLRHCSESSLVILQKLFEWFTCCELFAFYVLQVLPWLFPVRSSLNQFSKRWEESIFIGCFYCSVP